MVATQHCTQSLSPDIAPGAVRLELKCFLRFVFSQTFVVLIFLSSVFPFSAHENILGVWGLQPWENTQNSVTTLSKLKSLTTLADFYFTSINIQGRKLKLRLPGTVGQVLYCTRMPPFMAHRSL